MYVVVYSVCVTARKVHIWMQLEQRCGRVLMLMEPWILMPSWVLLLIGDGPGQTLSPWPRNHPS